MELKINAMLVAKMWMLSTAVYCSVYCCKAGTHFFVVLSFLRSPRDEVGPSCYRTA